MCFYEQVYREHVATCLEGIGIKWNVFTGVVYTSLGL